MDANGAWEKLSGSRWVCVCLRQLPGAGQEYAFLQEKRNAYGQCVTGEDPHYFESLEALRSCLPSGEYFADRCAAVEIFQGGIRTAFMGKALAKSDFGLRLASARESAALDEAACQGAGNRPKRPAGL